MGVASCNRGSDGLDGICPGICKVKPPGCGPPPKGFTLGEGGIARPSLGVLAPPFCRLPGIGGRSKGAGDDILDWLIGSNECEIFETLALPHSSIEDIDDEKKRSREEERKEGFKKQSYLVDRYRVETCSFVFVSLCTGAVTPSNVVLLLHEAPPSTSTANRPSRRESVFVVVIVIRGVLSYEGWLRSESRFSLLDYWRLRLRSSRRTVVLLAFVTLRTSVVRYSKCWVSACRHSAVVLLAAAEQPPMRQSGVDLGGA
jgi:hypothetical protein